MVWAVFSTNPYVEALTLNVIASGDKALKQVVKVKWGWKGAALVQPHGVLRRRGKPPEFSLSLRVHTGKATWGHRKKATSASCGETSQTPSLLAPQPPELGENTFLLFVLHSLRGLVTAAWEPVQTVIALLQKSVLMLCTAESHPQKHWFLTYSF